MSLEKNLQKILNRKKELEAILSSGTLTSDEVVKHSTELSEIGPVADQADLVKNLEKNLSETINIINDEKNENFVRATSISRSQFEPGKVITDDFINYCVSIIL